MKGKACASVIRHSLRGRVTLTLAVALGMTACTSGQDAVPGSGTASSSSAPQPTAPPASTGGIVTSTLPEPSAVTTTSTASVPSPTAWSVAPSSRRIELGAPDSYALLDQVMVYAGSYSDEEFGVGRLQELDGLPVGPAGFGVDEMGVVYIADGVRRRVLTVDPAGRIDVLDYTEVAPAAFQGFTVGPDGTQYITLNNGLAIGSGGELAARLSAAELGWDGIYRSPRASQRGMWTQQPTGEWILMVDSAGRTVGGVTSPSGSRPDVPLESAVDCRIGPAGELVVTVGENRATITVVVPAGVSGVVACTTLASGDVLVGLVESAELSQLVVLTIGTEDWSVGRLDLPPENMLPNGPYLVVGPDDRLFVEAGSMDAVTVSAVSPS